MRAADRCLIYGAYGYSGALIARHAVECGLRPLLAGRDGAQVAALASELGVDGRAIALDDAEGLRAALGEVGAVVHCAGPFVHTWRPMVEACLDSGTHYLDITGEADVFAGLGRLGPRAAAADLLLLPGVGFDVVPSDCLALHLARRLPEPRQLTLAFDAGGRPSRGTATTMLEHAHRGGMVRRGERCARCRPPGARARSTSGADRCRR